MNHVNAMLECDPDDIVLRKISAYGCHSFSYLICFIGLQNASTLLAETEQKKVPTF